MIHRHCYFCLAPIRLHKLSAMSACTAEQVFLSYVDCFSRCQAMNVEFIKICLSHVVCDVLVVSGGPQLLNDCAR